MGVFQKDPALRVGAICDVYEPNLENAVSAASKVPGTHPKVYRNYKELLADKDVQAVLIATPEHWHYQMVLDALAAGKDVYVEKPLCQTPEQGVALVEAEKKTKQIIQVGMQRRSYDLYQEGRAIVAAGKLGNVRMVRSWWLNNYLGARPPPSSPDRSIGNSGRDRRARRALDPDRFRNWRFYSDYAGGIVADQGAHVFDGIHMLMGAGFPVRRHRRRRQAAQGRAWTSRNPWSRSPNIPRISSASSPSTTPPCSTRAATISSISWMATRPAWISAAKSSRSS